VSTHPATRILSIGDASRSVNSVPIGGLRPYNVQTMSCAVFSLPFRTKTSQNCYGTYRRSPSPSEQDLNIPGNIFRDLPEFYGKAAAAGRHVIFTADQ